MPRPKAKSLPKLIADIEWISIDPTRRRTAANPDDIYLAYFLSQKTPRVRVNIGSNIIEKLGWKDGDCMEVCHHKDDVLNFRIIRRPEGQPGYKLRKPEHTTAFYTFNFRWPHENIKLVVSKAFKAVFEIYRNSYLIVDGRKPT